MEKNNAFSEAIDTLVVMVSPSGIPENFDILRLSGDTTEERDKKLSQSLNRFCVQADCGDFVPDNHLRVYEYGQDAHLENKFWQFTTDRESLAGYIDAREVAPSLDIPLRTAYYVHQAQGRIRSLEALQIGPDTVLPNMGSNLQEVLDRGHSLDRKSPLVHTVMSVGTDKGTLYFGNDGVGRACMLNYLQDIADHYFDAPCRNLMELRHSHTQANLTSLEFAEKTKDMFCLHNNAPIQRKIVYQDAGADQYMQGLRSSYPMGPNVRNFQEFINKFELTVSEKNQTICTLLNICNSGISDEQKPPARHRKEFSEVLQQLRKNQEQSPVQQAMHGFMQQQATVVAGRILMDKYGIAVRDANHPQLNRRVEVECPPKNKKISKPHL